MSYRLALIAALAGVLALAAPAAALVQTGTDLPALTLPDLDGQPHELQELAKGKVAVLVYWSVSCPLCRQQMPDFMKLYKRLAGNPFVMVLINGDGPAMVPAARAYAQRYGMPAPVLLDAGPGDSMPFGQKLDVIATPTVLVYDPAGKLVFAQEVKVDLAELTRAVENAF